MQFLKTLFWVVFAVMAMLFATNNWATVPLNLGDIVVDIKLPVLVIGAFLLGFLPTLLIYRARLWSLRRRFETQGPLPVANNPAPVRPTPTANAPGRQATDAKAWPAE